MAGSDDTLADAAAVRDRAVARRRGDDGAAAPAARRPARLRTRLTLIAVADALILLGAAIAGMVVPLGIFGALGVLLLLVAVTLAIAFAPSRGPRAVAPPAADTLARVELKALPGQTERWLAAQRPALPAPAVTLVDQIGVRLETLSPQLATLRDDQPLAADIRKLVGEQLPEFVDGYARVPTLLRTVPRNGRTPDAQLVDGLRVIEQQIGALSEQLAQGDLDTLQTRGRFLEIKYQGDGGGST